MRSIFVVLFALLIINIGTIIRAAAEDEVNTIRGTHDEIGNKSIAVDPPDKKNTLPPDNLSEEDTNQLNRIEEIIDKEDRVEQNQKEVISEDINKNISDRMERLTIKPASPTDENPSNNVYLYTVIVLLLLVNLVSLLIILWLFRWRRRLPDGQLSLVPEYLMQENDLLKEETGRLSEMSAETAKVTNLVHREVREVFSVIASEMDKKDKEMVRLRNGAEKISYIRDMRELVRILRMVERDIVEDKNSDLYVDSLEAMKDYLIDALRFFGLIEFSPKVGEDYRERSDLAEKPKFYHTNDPANNYKICRVVNVGYCYQTGGETLIIEPAVVSIYRFEKK